MTEPKAEQLTAELLSAEGLAAKWLNSWLATVARAASLEQLEDIRIAVLGKKGHISVLMQELRQLEPARRRQRGLELNRLKGELIDALETRKYSLQQDYLERQLADEYVDVTLPVRPELRGRIHPTSRTIEELIAYFGGQGFKVAQGPDIESEFYNFTALNFPPEHPARRMQDSFYLPTADLLLRTHTSPVQIRAMQNSTPPLRIIAPGRVYRSDYDMTHTPVFHQIEGLVVDQQVHMGHLKGCVIGFCRSFFGVADLPVRFRPSYFPFTEPSAEVDIGCERSGESLKIGSGGQWLEILGCGMVHPQVLINCGIDPDCYQGFAFGMGVERMAMLKYGIPDIRAFFESDIRWLDHYGFEALG